MGQDVYIYGILFIYIYINRQIFVLSTSVGRAQRAPIIPSGILSASPTLARYSAKLPLGAGLIRASWTYQIFMGLHSTYEHHP